ncbi:PGPGW domain-containing protein [Thiohalorhabdus sp.]|uniref:PGPGW domain-containing protein n=1 Tax=Thiohalorhabdus sp. TaxID=3094134 RepID=UPI002FC325A3
MGGSLLWQLWHWVQSNEALVGFLVAGSFLLLIFSAALLPFVVSLIPADYFAAKERGQSRFHRLHPSAHALVVVIKNLLGLVFLLGGMAMLVLPGQGLLTILVALILLDFPGKYRLEKRLVRSQRVVRSINWLRRRAGARPLSFSEKDQEERQ